MSARDKVALPPGRAARSGTEVPDDDSRIFLLLGVFGDEAIMDPGLPAFDGRFVAALEVPPEPPTARGPANVAFARHRWNRSTSS